MKNIKDYTKKYKEIDKHIEFKKYEKYKSNTKKKLKFHKCKSKKIKCNNCENISVDKLDNAYITKHNELLKLYRAYEILALKTTDYKKELDEYKRLKFTSKITDCQMKRMLEDQKYVMNSMDIIQDKLHKSNILNNNNLIDFKDKIKSSKDINNIIKVNKKIIKQFNETIKPIKRNYKVELPKDVNFNNISNNTIHKIFDLLKETHINSHTNDKEFINNKAVKDLLVKIKINQNGGGNKYIIVFKR